MWYMRVAPQHALPGATQLLDVLLPVISAGLEVVRALPGCEAGLARLQEAVGCFAYPHMPKLVEVEGRPVLRPRNRQHTLACTCMHRASIILAAGTEAREMIGGLVPDLQDRSKVDSAINQHKRCIMHQDLRDLGRSYDSCMHVCMHMRERLSRWRPLVGEDWASYDTCGVI